MLHTLYHTIVASALIFTPLCLDCLVLYINTKQLEKQVIMPFWNGDKRHNVWTVPTFVLSMSKLIMFVPCTRYHNLVAFTGVKSMSS